MHAKLKTRKTVSARAEERGRRVKETGRTSASEERREEKRRAR